MVNNEVALTFGRTTIPVWSKAHFHLFLEADSQQGTLMRLCHGWGAGPI